MHQVFKLGTSYNQYVAMKTNDVKINIFNYVTDKWHYLLNSQKFITASSKVIILICSHMPILLTHPSSKCESIFEFYFRFIFFTIM